MILPSGTVFQYFGHMTGNNLQDPRDSLHEADGNSSNGSASRNISEQENEKRQANLQEDLKHDLKRSSALITLNETEFSTENPCSTVKAAAAISVEYGWIAQTVFQSRNIIYQIFGFVKGQHFDPEYTPEGSDPLSEMVAKGILNARVVSTTSRVVSIPRD